MEYWLNAGFVDLGELTDLARHSEEVGFTGIAMADHLLLPEQFASAYPYSDDGSILWPRDTPWADPWVAIGAMASVTERLQFATGIQVAPLRDPFALAKSVATAARISGGRIRCGLGAGWLREEFDVIGVDFHSRGRRLDEMLEVLALLWTGDTVEYHGEFFDFSPMMMRPAARGTPIHIGGNSRSALQRASRVDGWIGTHRSLPESAAMIAKLDDLRSATATSGGNFHIGLTGPDLVEADMERLAELGVDSVTLPIAALGPGRSLTERCASITDLARRLAL